MIENYIGKVAVITGGASGIGKGLAERCCAEGMKVVIADIEEEKLKHTERELKVKYAGVISVVTDVSKKEDIEMLAKQTIDKYGAVHILVNNVGVSATASVIRTSIKDYKWILNVNLWGVIYGIHTFLPLMLKQDEDCHIINTSSGSGLIPGDASYGVAKFGVTALSEMLALELKGINSKVKISVLFPGIVNTNIITSRRNRPEDLKNPKKVLDPQKREKIMQRVDFYREMYTNSKAMLPKTVADIVFHAIEKDTLFIFTDLSYEIGIRNRTEQILNDVNILREFMNKSDIPKDVFSHKYLETAYKNRYKTEE